MANSISGCMRTGSARLVLLFLLWSGTASAQTVGESKKPDSLFRASLLAAVSAHGADLATTEYCLGTGRCRESNPFLLQFTTRPGLFGATKMGIAALGLLGTARLHESRPRLATILNFAVAGFFTGVAIHNTRVQDRP